MTKETSAEIAAIAGQVLNIEPVRSRHIAGTDYDALLTKAKMLAGSALSQREIIEAQANGEDIFELTPKMEVEPTSEDLVNTILAATRKLGSMKNDAESNFEFYVDGYTLASTDKVGEVRLTDYTGKTAVIKSKSLTDYFQRRLYPDGNPEPA